MQKQILEITKDGLKLGGSDFYLASGDFHYFRTLPGGWARRLELMRDFGLTAVQVYVPWNLHEKNEGEFDFSGILDLAAFLREADKAGLKVLLRPSPYICSECDSGGLPWWLLKNKNMSLRCNDSAYIAAIARYYNRLCPEFLPYLSTNGGPIIAVAIENEYGSRGNDKEYLKTLLDLLTENGVDVPFYTTDGPTPTMLKCGTLPGVWAGVNYRVESDYCIKVLREYQPDKPPFVGEMWSGRSMHWDEHYEKREVAPVAAAYKRALELGAYVNFYMFAGGTNFGFFSGANYGHSYAPREGAKSRYIPLLTSYDCDALIGEDGNVTEKYYACRAMLDEYLGKEVRTYKVSPMPEPQEILDIKLDQHFDLLENIEKLCTSVQEFPSPPDFEDVELGYGYMLYSTYLYGPSAGNKTLEFLDLRDRATVYLDGKYIGTAMRNRDLPKIEFEIPDCGARLDILVENMARVTISTAYQSDRKGLGPVRYDCLLHNWTVYPLPMEKIPDLYKESSETVCQRPSFYRGTFTAKAGVDTFLRTDGWERGFAMVNGFNLGRYWCVGPQETLYVPGELLKDGENTIELFEIHSSNETRTVSCVRKHVLDGKVAEVSP